MLCPNGYLYLTPELETSLYDEDKEKHVVITSSLKETVSPVGWCKAPTLKSSFPFFEFEGTR